MEEGLGFFSELSKLSKLLSILSMHSTPPPPSASGLEPRCWGESRASYRHAKGLLQLPDSSAAFSDNFSFLSHLHPEVTSHSLLATKRFFFSLIPGEDRSVRQRLTVRECGWLSSSHHPRELRDPGWVTDFSSVHPSIHRAIYSPIQQSIHWADIS